MIDGIFFFSIVFFFSSRLAAVSFFFSTVSGAASCRFLAFYLPTIFPFFKLFAASVLVPPSYDAAL